MKTRLLGAAVLIALVVLIVPMFFGTTPPQKAGDQSVSLAIPPAPDRELQTRTLNLDPSRPAIPASAATTAGSDQLATVEIPSTRPQDVEAAASAGTPGQPLIAAQPPAPAQPAAEPRAEPAPKPAPKAEPAPRPQPESTANVATRGIYTLSLSAYAQASSVNNLTRQVKALGYPVSTRPIRIKGQSLTEVLAGPFASRSQAEAARLKITQTVPGVPAHLLSDAVSGGSSPAAGSKPASSKAGGWAVQLAAVSSKNDALALRDKLRSNGFDGFVDSVQSSGRTLWRVRAGPQTRRDDAQRVHDQIKSRLGIDGNVVSVP